jgi:hypothetical protein
MGLITDVRVRRPANDDLVGRRFEVVGIRSGFEATIGMRLLSPKGRVIGTGSAQSTGGGIGVGEFSAGLRPVHGRADRCGQPPYHRSRSHRGRLTVEGPAHGMMSRKG